MEKIENLQDLATYLRANIDEEALFRTEECEKNEHCFKEFQAGFESGYANSYANLLCILDPEFKAQFDAKNSDRDVETETANA